MLLESLQLYIHVIWEGDAACKESMGHKLWGKFIFEWEPWGHQAKHQFIIQKGLQYLFITILMVSLRSALIASHSYRHFLPFLFVFSPCLDCVLHSLHDYEFAFAAEAERCWCPFWCSHDSVCSNHMQMLSFCWSNLKVEESVSDAFHSWA